MSQIPGPPDNNWLNCYFPDRSTSGANCLDDLIQILAASLIERLEDLAGTDVLNRLAQISDPDVQQETKLFLEEIEQLKNRLHQI